MRVIRDEERAGRGNLFFIGKNENALNVVLFLYGTPENIKLIAFNAFLNLDFEDIYLLETCF